jgi:hypothetical protein
MDVTIFLLVTSSINDSGGAGILLRAGNRAIR